MPEPELTAYRPSGHAGARLPHAWLPDGRSLYDLLGTGFTLPRKAPDSHPGISGLVSRARQRQIPLALAEPSASYPWRSEFLLVRPDQHIAWRTADPSDIDLDLVTGVSA